MNPAKDDLLFKRHYPGLDLLRSIAIILVLLIHFNRRFYPIPEEGVLFEIIDWGWNGVGLFFALSGFLIGGQIIEELQTGRFSFKKFYIKRFWRIFPPYYFSLLVVMVLFFAGSTDENAIGVGTTSTRILKDFGYHIFYLQNYITEYLIQGGVYWSLAIEEQFYILAPLCIYLLIVYARKYFSIIMCLLIGIPVIIRFFLHSPDINWLFDIRFPFHTRFDSLLMGVLAAYLFIKHNKRLIGLKAPAKSILLLFSLITLGICMVYGGDTKGYFNNSWQFTLAGPGFAVLTLWACISPFGDYIPAFLKKFFALIAKLSYTMYLYHLILLFPLTSLIRKFYNFYDYPPTLTGFIIIFLIYFLVVVIVSSVVYFFIDRPSMNHRRRVIERMDER